jgi:hypothetical protein
LYAPSDALSVFPGKVLAVNFAALLVCESFDVDDDLSMEDRRRDGVWDGSIDVL